MATYMDLHKAQKKIATVQKPLTEDERQGVIDAALALLREAK